MPLVWSQKIRSFCWLGLAAMLVVTLTSCGGERGGARSTHQALVPAEGASARTSESVGSALEARRARVQRLLHPNGIGEARFGEERLTVVATLARALGGPGTSIGPGLCGFEPYMQWSGLDRRPEQSGGRRLFRAELAVFFRHSRFVGYTYSDDQYLSRTTTESKTSIALNSPGGRQVLHGPQLTLATPQGLAPGNPFHRGEQLYGRTFKRTSAAQGTPPQPKLVRLPIWAVEAPSGRMYGSIDTKSTAQSFYARARPTIGSISAGRTPNTPCR